MSDLVRLDQFLVALSKCERQTSDLSGDFWGGFLDDYTVEEAKAALFVGVTSEGETYLTAKGLNYVWEMKGDKKLLREFLEEVDSFGSIPDDSPVWNRYPPAVLEKAIGDKLLHHPPRPSSRWELSVKGAVILGRARADEVDAEIIEWEVENTFHPDYHNAKAARATKPEPPANPYKTNPSYGTI